MYDEPAIILLIILLLIFIIIVIIYIILLSIERDRLKQVCDDYKKITREKFGRRIITRIKRRVYVYFENRHETNVISGVVYSLNMFGILVGKVKDEIDKNSINNKKNKSKKQVKRLPYGKITYLVGGDKRAEIQLFSVCAWNDKNMYEHRLLRHFIKLMKKDKNIPYMKIYLSDPLRDEKIQLLSRFKFKEKEKIMEGEYISQIYGLGE